MSTTRLPCIPSLRKQQLHLEFASLRRAAPPGLYVTLAPGDPTLWSGVVFVRSGPYASAILRFQIRFPDTYPDLPPLVTFATDVFHPLIVPLTTYTFSTGAASDDPVSATDEERLPPGGFSLRHGFPHWFGRAKRTDLVSGKSTRNLSGQSFKVTPETRSTSGEADTNSVEASDSTASTEQPADQVLTDDLPTRISQTPVVIPSHQPRPHVPVAELLAYVRSTFEDEEVLDSLPQDAAGNSGAWHAWRAHRRGTLGATRSTRDSSQARLPGDWHWDGIWARRVRDEIEASRSDAMLFGNSTRGVGEETIRFSRMDETTRALVKERMKMTIAEVTSEI
ncbi:hypothetical protein N7539_002946 [Penicillium diatomitis]|uniref:UBC core domain-containing protein n=1 Tax=Penicillium diatomitis TaxID=2819901 RepID=A0A9W9XFN7_9EURO|nr:uncharacterized protein N7539_002946 [Penicillium diatomitis]KAJ5491379.1 hypothetical protein N7539_002946 [Penicillium diatomitis]